MINNNSLRALLATTSLLLLPTALPGQNPPAQALFTIKLVDDTGMPVGDYPVNASTFRRSIPGQGFGRSENTLVNVRTDAKGLAVIEAPSLTGQFHFRPLDVAGYYTTHSEELVLKARDTNGKWQPWNPLMETVVRRKIQPIPLYAKKVGRGEKPLTVKPGVRLGYDLVVGDSVAPQGRGKVADLEILLGGTFKSTDEYDSSLTIAFSNPNDGAQAFARTFDKCVFTAPREAPEEGYASSLVLRRQSKKGQYDSDRLDDCRTAKGYFFRLRTVKDPSGKVVSAHYAKVVGGFNFYAARAEGTWVQFTYYLNPTVNDRNLEFDTQNNLHKELPVSEMVTSP